MSIDCLELGTTIGQRTVKVLILLKYYVPGYKAGGPVRTIEHLVRYLHTTIDFWIVTRDRDLGDEHPYPGVTPDVWSQSEHAYIYYSSSRAFSLRSIRCRVIEIAPDIVYLNSFFSPLTVRFLLLRRLGLIPPVSVLLAPRGELAQGALRLKAVKKRVYMLAASVTGLYSRVTWQATSQDEIADIHRFERNAAVHLAPNLPSRTAEAVAQVFRAPKKPGHARFIFLSRISPKKNLRFALETLRDLRGEIEFSIVGPAEGNYWEQCRQLIKTIPANVKITYQGGVPHEQVPEILGSSHFFLLPTFNENFGHAIFEAFSAGLPVIVSDQTPWRGLEEKGIGWDLSLHSPNQWRTVLQECVDMSASHYDGLAAAACRFAHTWPETSGVVAKNEAMFQYARYQSH